MELNLRKARKLESKIGEQIKSKKSLGTSAQVRVNLDVSKLDDFVIEARNLFHDELSNLNNLIQVKQDIRNLIAQANANVGINDFISQKLLLEANIALLNSLVGTDVYDRETVNDSIALTKKQQESERSSIYARTTLNVSFLSKIDKEKFASDKQKAQKDIESLEDKLAELNYSTKIKLNANSMKLLQDNGLV
jgi:primosomal protein N''